ncbi:alpha/beta fold hydrolase [Microbacterium sp. RU33B]|uniref:alpha/beta fold hydrolase n=1 Tax=Microbacterium sp. RU33B TaxID=1907390 RepID=UPI000963C2BC|nr:hypothetical protein [Microbacterium sp. RU33B]SIT70720.1 hypothetical protein SAMN05880545_0742 [Microbacterium sp. RU33B]
MSQIELEYASFGAPQAERLVLVLREGALATIDPDAAITQRRDVRVVGVRVTDDEVAEPGGYRGQSPAAVTVGALVELARSVLLEGSFAVVGVGVTGELAVRLALALPERVDRLVLVAVPAPTTPLDRDDGEDLLAGVQAKTLILNGQKDPDAAAAAAEWHRAHIASARVEMVPAVGAVDTRLALGTVWERVLSFTAPRTARRA